MRSRETRILGRSDAVVEKLTNQLLPPSKEIEKCLVKSKVILLGIFFYKKQRVHYLTLTLITIQPIDQSA